MKTRIILHGGLGNQLFQWAFGHLVGACGSEIEFVFFQRDNNVNHARTSLSSFLSNCQHGIFLEPIKSQSILRRSVKDPTFQKNILRNLPNYVLTTTENPFLHVSPVLASRNRYSFGYYQNWRSVEPISGVIIPEIWNALNTRDKTSLEMELYGAEVIHIRQNDTKSHGHMLRLGVLSENYYQKLPKRSNSRRIVLTDDVLGAHQVLMGLKVDGIFGPEDLDAYQALGVMARSTCLFAANSTLSWWGGFLAQNHGARVYIPNPFFREFNPEPALSFAHPSFQLLESHFMEIPH